MTSKNIIHRDIKPANILLNNNVAKIADFGFAKVENNPGMKEKYNVGTPLYMSLQALINNVHTVKNDIWSFGVMFYELLHGTTPWECKS
jgi:serine/threonine protein kinase